MSAADSGSCRSLAPSRRLRRQPKQYRSERSRTHVNRQTGAGPKRVTRYEWEPSYVGIQTFLKLPLCLSPEDLKAGEIDLAVGGIPWDGTNTARAGTHLGPSAIRRCDNARSPPMSRPSQLVRVDPFDHLRMADDGDAQVVPGNTPMTFTNIRTFVSEMLEAGVIPCCSAATTQ